MFKKNTTYIFLLRISLAWLFLYAGLSKITHPNWSAAGYLQNASTFPSFYQFLTQPNLLPYINVLNEWSLTFLGLSLLFGIGLRLSTKLGALLMLLYYFPVLQFPYIGKTAFLIDEHIIYAFALLSIGYLSQPEPLRLDPWIQKQYQQFRQTKQTH